MVWGCDLELNRTLVLLLTHYRPRRQSVAVPNQQLDQVAGAQLAVDTKIEQGKAAQSALHLQADADCPDFLEADELSLIPGSPTRRSTISVPGDPLSVEGD